MFKQIKEIINIYSLSVSVCHHIWAPYMLPHLKYLHRLNPWGRNSTCVKIYPYIYTSEQLTAAVVNKLIN